MINSMLGFGVWGIGYGFMSGNPYTPNPIPYTQANKSAFTIVNIKCLRSLLQGCFWGRTKTQSHESHKIGVGSLRERVCKCLFTLFRAVFAEIWQYFKIFSEKVWQRL